MASIFDIEGIVAPRQEGGGSEKGLPSIRSKNREAPASLSSSEAVTAKRRLADMVMKAFETLQEAMETADHNTAIKAAQIVLDRSGFGPKTTMDINTTSVDLTALSRDQLAERAAKIASIIREKKEQARTIDVPPTSPQEAVS